MDAGKLIVTVAWDGARCVSASVASSRTQAASALRGRAAAEVVALVPRLFSLCGRAQGFAARLALAAANGEDAFSAAAQREVALEAIGEHLWRLYLDWPPMLGDTPRLVEFRQWRQRLLTAAPDGDAALAADLLAALPTLVKGLPDDTTPAACALLPAVSAADWGGDSATQAIDEAYAAAPLWQGAPAETGALARQAAAVEVAARLADGRRIAARLAARLADLRQLAQGLLDPERLAGWSGAAQLAPGVGLARVETARGLLLHLMQVKDGRVAAYAIVAPTEWNFHPRGAFVGEIVGRPAATRDEAEMLARRLALSLDPCVSYEVVVEVVENA